MKKYEEPMLNVEALELADVITTSGDNCSSYQCDYDMGGF